MGSGHWTMNASAVRTYSIQFTLAIAICFKIVEMLMLMMILLFVCRAIQFNEYYNVFRQYSINRTVAQTLRVCVFENEMSSPNVSRIDKDSANILRPRICSN